MSERSKPDRDGLKQFHIDTLRDHPGGDTPPQGMAAEQSVLGSMLISKDAIADVSEVLRGVDFYRPSHETVRDVVAHPGSDNTAMDCVVLGALDESITTTAKAVIRKPKKKVCQFCKEKATGYVDKPRAPGRGAER